MLPQYSDKTSKSKSGSRLDKLSTSMRGKFFIQQVGRCRSCHVPVFCVGLPGHDQLGIQSLWLLGEKLGGPPTTLI